jgi:hypothetical protein
LQDVGNYERWIRTQLTKSSNVECAYAAGLNHMQGFK